MTYVYPSGTNTFVPNARATGNLQIEFSRNPESFALPNYAATRSVDKTTGYFWQIDPSEAIRIQGRNDYAWPPSQEAPDGRDGTARFQLAPYTTNRWAFPFTLDAQGVEQADFDIVAAHSRIHAQKAMTHRTLRALQVLTTTANWGTSTAASATAVGAGPWDSTTASDQNINKTIHYVRQFIHRATAGAIDKRKLMCVVSPELAKQMRASQEIIDFVKQQQQSGGMITNNDFFQEWGIPEKLYGMKFIVEDAVILADAIPIGTTLAQKQIPGTSIPAGSEILGAGSLTVQPALFLYKADGAEEMADPPSNETNTALNTFTNFLYEDMTVEQKQDIDNRLLKARVVDITSETITAFQTGFYLVDVLA
jgi:hypothetical protein